MSKKEATPTYPRFYVPKSHSNSETLFSQMRNPVHTSQALYFEFIFVRTFTYIMCSYFSITGGYNYLSVYLTFPYKKICYIMAYMKDDFLSLYSIKCYLFFVLKNVLIKTDVQICLMIRKCTTNSCMNIKTWFISHFILTCNFNIAPSFWGNIISHTRWMGCVGIWSCNVQNTCTTLDIFIFNLSSYISRQICSDQKSFMWLFHTV